MSKTISLFTYSSILNAPAADVFRWHERSEALATLTPGGLVRIEKQSGGIRDDGRVTVSVGVGPARFLWTLRHFGYLENRRFCDEQVKGPFAVWRHAHLFEPLGPDRMRYEDRIEFAIPGPTALSRPLAGLLRPVLALSFADRHRTVRAHVVVEQQPASRRWPTAAIVVGSTAALLVLVRRAWTRSRGR